MDTEIYSYDGDKIQKITAIEFTVWGNEDIARGSALGKDSGGIQVPDLFEGTEPKREGLIDGRMGPSDDSSECVTCGLNNIHCVGHFGHITLAEPVFHMGYLTYVKKILSCICLKCSKLLIYKNEKEIQEMLKNKSGKHRLSEIRNLVKGVTMCQKMNFGCGTPVSKIKSEVKKSTLAITLYSETNLANLPKEEGAVTDGKKKIKEVLTPDHVYHILKNISDEHCEMMGIDPKKSRPEMMIHKIFPVPPVSVRPSVKADFVGSGTMEDDLTHKLADIIKANIRIARQKDSENGAKFALDHYQLLQFHIASYQDSDANIPKSEQKGKVIRSLGPRLKGKDGRIRGNLQGKRVDFSARSVITSDPTISINELGVPVKIAMNLTFPEVVTPQNIDHLSKLVKNGRDVYPGANFIFPLSTIIPGQQVLPIDLRFRKEKVELHYGDIVERHLANDDIVLLNRQPTLHKQSMMGHRVKVINDTSLNTFRLNVAVTTPYNADFDGDEMNIFLPQSVQSKIELEEIADVKRQIITPATSRTIIGIVQDGLIGSYNLTSPNMRIDWRSAMNIMSYTSIDKFSSFKKNKDYTGHELFSMIIPPKINVSRGEGDKQFLIKNGILEKGTLSKELLGSKKKNNLTQLIWDEYGVEAAKDFLNDTQRLVNNFNLYNGFTVGVGDAYIGEDVNKQIFDMFQTKDLKVAHMITGLENNPDLMDIDLFERTLFAELNVIREDVSKLIMENLDPKNNFKIMILSGSKGEPANMGQMSGCAGLQAFEGKLIPKKLNNRTLPYFHRDDDSSSSRGLIKNPFIRGITFPEYIFLNMTGREGLIDQAIKTAESGYIQRKLIKSMEDAMIRYDGTVRSASNTIVQFVYGDSGAETTKQYEYNMKLLEMNNIDIAQKHKFTKEELKNYSDFTNDDNDKIYKTIIDFRDTLRIAQIKTRLNYLVINTIYMLPVSLPSVIDNIKHDPTLSAGKGKLTPKYIVQKFDELVGNEQTQLLTMKQSDRQNHNSVKYKDDRLAKTALFAALYDSLSPKRCIIEYGLNLEQFDAIVTSVKNNFNKNIAEPGEMVGIVAAQSLGEPTTQLSVVGESRVCIINNDCQKCHTGQIGEFIDKLFDDPTSGIRKELQSCGSSHTGSEILLSEDYYVNGVTPHGAVEWCRIESVSRHQTAGQLVEIITKSGRTVTATLSHSFLKFNGSCIVPTLGSDLNVGDYLPVAYNIPTYSNKILTLPPSLNENTFAQGMVGTLCGMYMSGHPKIKEHFKSKVEQIENIIQTAQNIGSIIKSPKSFIHGVICGYLKITKKWSYDISMLLLLFGIFTIKENDEICILKEHHNEFNKIFGDVPIGMSETKYKEFGDIMWDEIISCTILPDPHKYVYDFTIPGLESFMVDSGLFVHNTLNSFHHSGIAEISTTTQGVPRIKELLSLTKNLKTPQMIIYLTPEYAGSKDMANKIASYITYTTFSHIRSRIDVYYDPYPLEKGGFMEKDNATKIYTTKSTSKYSPQDDVTRLPWLMRIELNKEKMYEKEVTLLDIKSKFCKVWENKHYDKTIKGNEKIVLEQITQYAIISNSDNDQIPIIHIRFDIQNFDQNIVNDFITFVVDKFKLKGIPAITNISAISEKRVLSFDNENQDMEKSKQHVIYTAGANLYDIRYFNGIDINKTICNDVVAMYETFGIEAARATLVREIIYAYELAGSGVNYHHVSLLVDLMTINGYMTSIDRHGMNKSDVGPLSKASFETPVDKLQTAAVFGEVDNMNGVSSRIMAGLVIKGGTGLCNVLLDTEAIQNSEYMISAAQKHAKDNVEIVENNIMLDLINRNDDEGGFVPT